ncbi:hypothetical protein JKF63_00508 [Porcisia hertigi]|uniref:Transmembrane 9 superfamily member n=1 Tax=Porcisia hertigi TaxID=2761500 RepID=A0A836L6Y2_9TRYP|nr:hypothetical protein JKF63_00508 [Porcisia hertigi]
MSPSAHHACIHSSSLGVGRHRISSHNPLAGAVLLVLLLLLLQLTTYVTPANAIYVPGASEVSYQKGETVKIMVNALRSSSEMFPIDYAKMPFCQPAKPERKEESFGEIIWGDRVLDSLYTVKMMEDVMCMPLPHCDFAQKTEEIRDRHSKNITKMINQRYRVYMSIDNLPAFSTEVEEEEIKDCPRKLRKYLAMSARGFPLGLPARCRKDAETALNNHIEFTIQYNRDSLTDIATEEAQRKYIVVFVGVKAKSIAWTGTEQCIKRMTDLPGAQEVERKLLMSDVVNKAATVYWTYSVRWEENPNVRWATRWDFYLTTTAASQPGAHVMFIIFSFIMVLVIGSAVLGLLLRTLHKDFNRYNSEDPEDMCEEVGWKLLHADVFRPPFNANWLAILVANGVQVLITVGVVLIVALMGFLSPSRRGALLKTLLLTAAFTSSASGYVCGLLLQYLNCRAWRHVFTCSLTLPGAILIMYVFILIINKAHGATTAIPLTTLLQILALCVTVSLPLTVLGGSIAFCQQPIVNPTRVGRLAREIPAQKWSHRPWFMYSFWPCVPLVVTYIELHYIMQDLWEGRIYYSFGFLTLTACIWVLLCALTTISTLYYTLCYENHRWWWTAYFVPGGAGVHIFCMSVIFFTTYLSVSSFSSAVIFFAYMGMVSYLYGLAAGAVGVTVSIAFVRMIYSSIKID